jgi:acetyl esterase/lipase
VTIDYRLTGVASFPAQIEDCKCAIRFLRARAKEYKINPDSIGVWGSSAGGHLVSLLGTSGGVAEFEGEGGWTGYSSRVQAVCPWAGPADLVSLSRTSSHAMMKNANPIMALIGGTLEEKKQVAVQASPVSHITPDDPPFLIFHGENDTLVPPGQAKLLHESLRKGGVESELHIIKGGGHGVATAGAYFEIYQRMRTFFDKHLRNIEE